MGALYIHISRQREGKLFGFRPGKRHRIRQGEFFPELLDFSEKVG
jgi:hypothetical protein